MSQFNEIFYIDFFNFFFPGAFGTTLYPKKIQLKPSEKLKVTPAKSATKFAKIIWKNWNFLADQPLFVIWLPIMGGYWKLWSKIPKSTCLKKFKNLQSGTKNSTKHTKILLVSKPKPPFVLFTKNLFTNINIVGQIFKKVQAKKTREIKKKINFTKFLFEYFLYWNDKK